MQEDFELRARAPFLFGLLLAAVVTGVILGRAPRPVPASEARSASLPPPPPHATPDSPGDTEASLAALQAQQFEIPFPAFRRSALEVERLLASAEELSAPEVSDALRRLRFCRELARSDFGEGHWASAAATLCLGTGADPSFDLGRVDEELLGSDEIATIDLGRERSERGSESAFHSADEIVRLSMDPGELQAALSLLIHMNQSLGVRLSGRDIPAGAQGTLETLAVGWYRCALRGACGAESFETVSYCLRARCSPHVGLAAAYQETLPSRDFAYVVQVRQFLGLPTPRPMPPARPIKVLQ